MPVIDVTEDLDERPGSYQADQRTREYTRRFTVYTSTHLDNSNIVLNALEIPRLWSPYVSGTGMDLRSFCRSVDANLTDNPTIWKVVARYSSRIDRPDLNQPQFDRPDLKPPKISYHTTRQAVPMVVDADGLRVHNSADWPYDPTLDREEKIFVIRITRNQLQYNPVFAHDFQDSLNDRPFFGFKKGAVKCAEISADLQFEAGVYYWQVNFQFEMRKENIPPRSYRVAVFKSDPDGSNRQLVREDGVSYAWHRWVLDRGSVQADGRDCVSKHQQPIVGLLDGNGSQLAFSSEPYYRGHQEFPYRDFRKLNLY